MARAVTITNVADVKMHLGSHGRTADLRAKQFPLDTGVPDVRMEFAWLLAPVGYGTPRHHHVFDQIRYVIDGEWPIGKNATIKAGECGYFPEGVHYGPQMQQVDCTALILQFPGPSGITYMTHRELHDAQTELEKEGKVFENGVCSWRTPDGRKVNMDSHKACWEKITGRELHFPKGRFGDTVIMRSDACAWVPDRKLAGVEHKHLGTFGEYRTGMGLTRLAKGATLSAHRQQDAEILYLLDGTIVYEGKTWQGGGTAEQGTYIYLPHDTDVKDIVSPTGGTFFTIALPMIAEMEAQQRRGVAQAAE
jgi:quercetin dioxygenase-like cupin family protein